MKISACIITKNEGKNVARCIESFKKVVYETIVVDTGSSDRTEEIAASLGAKVFRYEWDNNFSNAKNYALEQAKGDWIIFLDADEYFYGETGCNLPKVIKAAHKNKKVDGLLCKFFHLNGDDYDTVISTDFLLRIFRNSKKIRYSGNIHESLASNGLPLNSVRVPENLIKIYHTGYSSDIVSKKIERNLSLLLENLNNNNVNEMTYYYLADCYFGVDDYELAIKYARKFIETGKTTMSHNFKPYLIIINSMIISGCPGSEILKEIDTAIAKFSKHPDLHRLLGLVYFGEQRYRKAEESFNTAVQLENNYDGKEVSTFSAFSHGVYYRLGLIAGYKNEYSMALEHHVKALNERKREPEIFEELIKLIRNENPEDIIFLLKRIYDEHNEHDVEFLVNNLAKYKMGIVLMYFHKMWIEKFGKEDITAMFMLLSIGKYEESFKHFAETMVSEDGEWAEVYAVIAAILSGNNEFISTMLNQLRPSLKRIVEAYYEINGNAALSSDNLADYITLLKEFILLRATSQVNKLLALKTRFNIEVSGVIGDVFLNNMIFQGAISQYMDTLNNGADEAETYFKLGCAYYKLYDYGNAVEMFKAAKSSGYEKNGIYEYLNWISEKCSDERTKSEAAAAALV